MNARTRNDARIQAAEAAIDAADRPDKSRLRGELDELRSAVHAQKLGDVAAEFDKIHNIERALEVGSLHRIISAADLRPYLIDAIDRGIHRYERAVKGATSVASSSSGGEIVDVRNDQEATSPNTPLVDYS